MIEIKNIIFDLGGVLMNIDYNKTTRAFKDLGFENFEDMYSQFKANNIFEGLETGHVTEMQFHDYLMSVATRKISNGLIVNAWNAMLLDFRVNSLVFLKQLNKTHRLFLLSNTNIIHKTAFDILFNKQAGPPPLESYFTKAFYSHEVGLRKPNKDIFEHVLHDAGIIANETIFIDDISSNVETAKKLGFKTHLLLPAEKIEDLDYV